MGEEVSSRRKACDLCFIKKIKCDMLKPACSNCKLYDAQCRTSVIRRRPKPPPRDAAGPALPPAESVTVESTPRAEGAVEARLDRIEAELREMRSKASGWDDAAWREEEVDTLTSSPPRWSFSSTAPSLYYGSSDEPPTLPALEDIIPVIDRYFNTTNRTTPLFDQSSFMRTLTAWYNKPADRDRSTWASILMVSVLGLRSELDVQSNYQGGFLTLSRDKTRLADYCLRNAQSAMPEVVTRANDLTGIRVLLALTAVYLATCDLAPASVLVGSAVRLAHRLHLHAKESEQYFNAQENSERARVFWIAYIYDKAISLRGKMPPTQLDADIDIPIPPANPADGAGLIHTLDGRATLSIFRLRVNLAHIEGKVHDLLYSNRASKIPSPERQQRVVALQAMLDRWYGGIPYIFRLGNISPLLVSSSDLVEVTLLYHAYLLCLVSIHGIYSFQADWMARIGSLARAAVEDYARSMHGVGGSASCNGLEEAPPGMDGWQRCLEVSRGCIRLFHETRLTERLLWPCFCPHFSGLIVLLSNLIIEPTSESVAADQMLAGKSTALLKEAHAFCETLPATMTVVKRLVDGLSSVASRAVDKARKEMVMLNTSVEWAGAGLGDGVDELGGEGVNEWEFGGLFDAEQDMAGCAFYE